MTITKLQQFIIFNCDQSEITIPSTLNSKVSKMIKISQPIGSSTPTWDPDAPALSVQFNKLTPNIIYLVTSKDGQLPYDIAGAVEAINYCK
jgi:hypothetical protein